ncbi:hypothetical protein CFAM422_012038 [Trichoderma lentiforme]|uniref:Uncharacterized protein n=1 Tax=Trichoderma lentiforme TaxID=1567552 RepID=A0A9P4X4J6_9HYPO|nr:hypothetical protein CFAM422_012038 [Trichoderma lentiforme]
MYQVEFGRAFVLLNLHLASASASSGRQLRFTTPVVIIVIVIVHHHHRIICIFTTSHVSGCALIRSGSGSGSVVFISSSSIPLQASISSLLSSRPVPPCHHSCCSASPVSSSSSQRGEKSQRSEGLPAWRALLSDRSEASPQASG